MVGLRDQYLLSDWHDAFSSHAIEISEVTFVPWVDRSSDRVRTPTVLANTMPADAVLSLPPTRVSTIRRFLAAPGRVDCGTLGPSFWLLA